MSNPDKYYPHPSGIVRAANATGRALQQIGLAKVPLEEGALCETASERMHLSDFGNERFREGLRRQLNVYQHDPGLTFLGRGLARLQILRCLGNRLEIENQIAKNPEITRRELRRPMVIVSMPRTGTTFLHNLMGRDPASRPLLLWEAMHPGRDSEGDPAKRDRKRRQWAGRFVSLAGKVAPGFKDLHFPQANDAEECLWLFQNSFFGPALGQKNLCEYSQQMPQETIEWAYREYYRQLQLLEAQRPAPGHWLLKCCNHIFTLDTLVKTVPGVCIVQIHRDPTESIASLCRVFSQIATLCYDDDRWKTFGPDVLALFADGLKRSIEARKSIPTGQILDITFQELTTAPVATVQKIYDHFGYTFTNEFGAAMDTWLKDKPRPKRAQGYYSFEPFGMDRATVEKAFAFYNRQFDLPPDNATA